MCAKIANRHRSSALSAPGSARAATSDIMVRARFSWPAVAQW
jgi:hypothetical protein